MKMDDWVGRYVMTRRRLETEGGEVFPAGEVMVVTGHWRGRLDIARPARREWCEDHGQAQTIRGVDRRVDVELLPLDPKKCVEVAVEGIHLMASSLGLRLKLCFEIEEPTTKRPRKVQTKKAAEAEADASALRSALKTLRADEESA